MRHGRILTLISSALWAYIALISCSFAQTYPTKPVRLIVPFSAGGGADIVARAIAQKLGDALAQQFVVDNRTGAAAIIGTELAAKSAPDGYTLFLGQTGPNSINLPRARLSRNNAKRSPSFTWPRRNSRTRSMNCATSSACRPRRTPTLWRKRKSESKRPRNR